MPPPTSALTLVTGFWSPKALDRPTVRSEAIYLHLFSELVRRVNFPMIVLIEPRLEEAVTAIVEKEKQKRPNVKVRPTPLADVPYVTDREERFGALVPPHNVVREKDTIGFSRLTWAKPELVRRVAEEDPFGTTHFGWIDFGVAHVAEIGARVNWSDVEAESTSTDKVRICERMATAKSETDDAGYFYAYNSARVCGGFFTGTAESLRRLATVFDAELERMAEAWRFVLEEQVLAALTARHPDLFELWYADYFGLFTNVKTVQRDVATVLANLAHSRKFELWENGRSITRQLLDAMIRGGLRLEPDECVELIDDGLACARHKDLPLAKRLALIISALGKYSGTMHSMLRTRRDRTRSIEATLTSLEQHVPWTWEEFIAQPDAHAWLSCL